MGICQKRFRPPPPIFPGLRSREKSTRPHVRPDHRLTTAIVIVERVSGSLPLRISEPQRSNSVRKVFGIPSYGISTTYRSTYLAVLTYYVLWQSNARNIAPYSAAVAMYPYFSLLPRMPGIDGKHLGSQGSISFASGHLVHSNTSGSTVPPGLQSVFPIFHRSINYFKSSPQCRSP
ncbi:hypothetical protein BGZ63DRAFT_58014 [Mariannaea sp. PMI_226]|nr:hypothetical protein BGZ63DRAFT_58014 [Mariannaea sp. PMI_226]